MQVQNVIDMPDNDELSLLEASRCFSQLLNDALLCACFLVGRALSQ
jgi:hypothetical protein